jgi:hypothetical protein
MLEKGASKGERTIIQVWSNCFPAKIVAYVLHDIA